MYVLQQVLIIIRRARIAAPMNIHIHTPLDSGGKTTLIIIIVIIILCVQKMCAAALGEQLGLFVCENRETGVYFRMRKMELGGHIQDDGTGEYDSRRNGTCIHAHGTKSRAASFTTLPTLLCSHT